jgi:hypothetical protein
MFDSELAPSLPQAIGPSRVRRRFGRALVFGSYAYPALVVASLYLTWFAAWAALGHSPRPSLDDPKFIGLLVDIPYIATMGMLIGALGAMLLGVGLTPFILARSAKQGQSRVNVGLVVLLVHVLLWGAALWFLRVDPWDVGTWYVD